MPASRITQPIVSTYLTVDPPGKKKPRVHARVVSPSYDLDRRGTGRDPAEASALAKKNLRPPK